MSEEIKVAVAYVSNYRIPSKQFKKDSIRSFIRVDGVPHYPMKNFQFDSRDIRRMKRRTLTRVSDGEQIEIYY